MSPTNLLRFITCGSVDDGKSTLTGRLLWDSKLLSDDQIKSLEIESKKFGTQGENLDFALLVDGLQAEREQGITIDVAYRFFSTPQRRFIVADTPGHEQYTRNMITGASTADLAVILVDARKGLLTQTWRHAYLCSLMGIRHLVLAINKMDLVNYDSAVFSKIQQDFAQATAMMNFKTSIAIPLSALKGDNITERSSQTPWYQGPSLMGYLNQVDFESAFDTQGDLKKISKENRFIFPVQLVNRPNSSFRGFSGSIAEGQVCVGDEVHVFPSGKTANVASIFIGAEARVKARAPEAITLTLDQEIDVSRGDVFSLAKTPLETTDQFQATIVWLSEEPGLPGRSYDLKLATQWTQTTLTQIKYKVDVNSLNREAATVLGLNDICVCTLATNKPLVFDKFATSKTLGGFILVDRFSNATVGVGMINHKLRRGKNIRRQPLTVKRSDREKLNGHPGKVIWFTGLSGAGKSSLANKLESELHVQGYRTILLDGDNIRHGLNKDLGFTDADRVENVRRVAEVAKLMLEGGLVVIIALISPFKQERQMARALIGENSFIEVYINTPLAICEARDPKGLYRKARNGELPNLSGIGSVYEAPENPELTINGSGAEINDRMLELLSGLKSFGLISGTRKS